MILKATYRYGWDLTSDIQEKKERKDHLSFILTTLVSIDRRSGSPSLRKHLTKRNSCHGIWIHTTVFLLSKTGIFGGSLFSRILNFLERAHVISCLIICQKLCIEPSSFKRLVSTGTTKKNPSVWGMRTWLKGLCQLCRGRWKEVEQPRGHTGHHG